MNIITWAATAAFAASLLLLVGDFVADRLARGRTIRPPERPYGVTQGDGLREPGSRPWNWIDEAWDEIWPASPGTRWLARPALGDGPYFVPNVWGAAIVDLGAEEEWKFLHGGVGEPPWKRF